MTSPDRVTVELAELRALARRLNEPWLMRRRQLALRLSSRPRQPIWKGKSIAGEPKAIGIGRTATRDEMLALCVDTNRGLWTGAVARRVPSIARVGSVVMRWAAENGPGRAYHFDRATLGGLAARYLTAPWNRHDARRWMRRFRIIAGVASDALQDGSHERRLQAIRTLCGMVGVEDALRLTDRPRGLAESVTMTIAIDDGGRAPMWNAAAAEVRKFESPIRLGGR